MGINFSALNKGSGREQAVHPRDIFNALPNKPRGMDYLRGPQDQVLDEWWKRRAARDLVIKMNTGGGKTIVGLLVAQSSLAEGTGPAVYLVPDHYLVEQVVAEAQRLGIAVTTDPRDMAYARGRAILVDVFQRLFNGQSVFGVDGSVGRTAAVQAPGTVIIDDAHACLGKAEHAFRLSVPEDDPVYEALLALFKDALEQQSPASYLDLADGRDPARSRWFLTGRGSTGSARSWRGCTRSAAKGRSYSLGRFWSTSCPTAARSSRPGALRSRLRASTPMSFLDSGRPGGTST